MPDQTPPTWPGETFNDRWGDMSVSTTPADMSALNMSGIRGVAADINSAMTRYHIPEYAVGAPLGVARAAWNAAEFIWDAANLFRDLTFNSDEKANSEAWSKVGNFASTAGSAASTFVGATLYDLGYNREKYSSSNDAMLQWGAGVREWGKNTWDAFTQASPVEQSATLFEAAANVVVLASIFKGWGARTAEVADLAAAGERVAPAAGVSPYIDAAEAAVARRELPLVDPAQLRLPLGDMPVDPLALMAAT